MNDDWDDLDKKIEARLNHSIWWVSAALTPVAVYLVLSAEPPTSWLRGTFWNRANPSLVIWDYRNPSPRELIRPVWNLNNPSPVQCSKYTGPNYRPEGDNGYNPAPDYLPWLPQPYCWTCHSNTYVQFGNISTALAHSDGHPVAVGDM